VARASEAGGWKFSSIANNLRQILMVEQQIGYTERIERRRFPRQVSNSASLSWALALAEGAAASLVMLLPALAYHLLMRASLASVPYGLYAAYALLVGSVYGGLSFLTAGKFLSRSTTSQSIIAEAALSWTAAFAVALFAAFLLGLADELSRVSLTASYAIGIPALLITRNAAYAALTGRITAGRLQYQKVAVVGDRTDVVRFLLNGHLWKAGYQLSGTLYLEDIRHGDGRIDEAALVEFAHRWLGRGAENLVLVGGIGDVDRLERLATALKRFAINAICAPATDNASFKFLDVVPIGPNNAVRFLRKPMGDGAVALKRAFDVAGAACGLVLLAPLFAIVALLIKLDSPGSVFYRQERRGFNGETFHIWKFRSMTVTESGRAMTQVRAGDRRITRVGAFIRRTSIDELPQLINVLSGKMSLVGPRPHALMHDDEFGHQIAEYAHRQRIKPGITGWAQVNGFRGETSTLDQITGRTAHDLYYIDNWSIFFDCWIVLLTILSPRTRRNAV
jgi:Undecaprenyl-phosphate glucose phosphotransferase